ncbi:tRNA threonylcarbamoyladenosine biosynthesis protein TsaE [Arthrobacter stackebrandtii]|uniref:tRNA threonylcarbamoyladenosine biosynthesis protein TsaE n=1 Tax=Arthrobacter stackebrandtii TaxID=272161 RepID=A0ABS4YY51_9MICC|nr:tRNA (adenosine(37)-N6)-threonylcarbamoyltransferase complex ATPase subunit type 1 TsaE [Arthrobacter stackebrandtii]MBP2413375.1 tRNA threonylcarbamoyladenosine biosynthesis protein TsaE [Arthrobacter stackebrandtii]PYG99535.1 tRNA (adenosine(37)-N6)-threonylcarbamoyltransferase complex ATPase subunit type 1 TsaE [Arthrobacter stackebrandtii]
MSQWEFATGTAAATQQLAENLAPMLRAGDLIILSGGLGAGKTTFTQGLGRSLGVREGIISPTFVLVRIHPNLVDGHNPGGPDLVHVDAYRLAGPGEIDDIDLENTMDSAVTVVEWGVDRVEHLADSRLEIELVRAVGGEDSPGETSDGGTAEVPAGTLAGAEAGNGTPGGPGAVGHAGSMDFADTFDDADTDDDEPRVLRLRAVGPRWDGVDFSRLDQPAAPRNSQENTTE